MLSFAVELAPDDNGTVMATCPDLPEVTTFGDDERDALSRAVDAICEAIAARIADREEVPVPSADGAPGMMRVAVPTQVALTVLLYRAMREQGVRKAELARRLHWARPQVDRLFDPLHNTRIDQFDAAFAALGRRIEVLAE